VTACLLVSLLRANAASNEPVSVFMPDGHRKSHLLRVYVNADIETNAKPELTLLPGRFLNLRPPGWTQRPILPIDMARSQQWTEKRDGIAVPRNGTLLLFDLRDTEFTLMPWVRVTPRLRWGQPIQTAISDREVYIGNEWVAAPAAFFFVGTVAVGLGILAARIKGQDGNRAVGLGCCLIQRAAFRSPKRRPLFGHWASAAWSSVLGLCD